MTLTTEKRTLLTVITESAIEELLLKDLDKLGVHGYTVSDARGRGGRGMRDATWGEVSNIRLEVICNLAPCRIAHTATTATAGIRNSVAVNA